MRATDPSWLGNIDAGVLDIEPLLIARRGLELSSLPDRSGRATLTRMSLVHGTLARIILDRHAGMGGLFRGQRRLFAEGGRNRAVIRWWTQPEGAFSCGAAERKGRRRQG